MHRSGFWWGLAALLVVQAGEAQTFGRMDEMQANMGYYFLAREGEATVQVTVLGTVGNTGIYEVGEGMGVGQLVAISRTGSFGARERSVRREVTYRLLREVEGQGRIVVYQASEEDMLHQRIAEPLLKDGDLLIVEVVTHRRFTWRDGVQIVTAISALALAIDRISRTLSN